MSSSPNHPHGVRETPPPPPGEVPPQKSSSPLLWILLLLALIAIGWYFLSQRDAAVTPVEPVTPIGDGTAVPSDSPVSAPAASRDAPRERRPAAAATTPDRDARPTSQPEPAYPTAAQRARVEGTVVVRADIDANGDPVNVEVAESSRNRDLDRAATTAVRGWKFEPAIRNGEPVASTVQVPVNFRLENQ